MRHVMRHVVRHVVRHVRLESPRLTLRPPSRYRLGLSWAWKA